MQLVREGRFVTDVWQSEWFDTPASEPVSAPRAVVEARRGLADVPLAGVFWHPFLHTTGTQKAWRIGVGLAAHTDAQHLPATALALPLIAIVFATQTDGRGFSFARHLRELGFAQALRAVGPLIPDQAEFLRRSGFDSVAVPYEAAARHGEQSWFDAWHASAQTYVPHIARMRSRVGARNPAPTVLEQRLQAPA